MKCCPEDLVDSEIDLARRVGHLTELVRGKYDPVQELWIEPPRPELDWLQESWEYVYDLASS